VDQDDEDESVTIYSEYKLIIKELLFNGASRTIKNSDGETPLEILNERKDGFTYN
jgi:ankyrin repeat protein